MIELTKGNVIINVIKSCSLMPIIKALRKTLFIKDL